ncbi:MAG TPA: DUF4062 domain-containing protein [Longimicrobiaceae bacterium]
MVSSTYTDLVEHREAVVDALLRLGFFPVGMEFDSAKAGKDVVRSSLEMVEKAHAYVGILSHRYGWVPKDARRNPGELSVTELEYRRALERGIPVYMFLMGDDHPVKAADVEKVEAYQGKLRALRADAQANSITASFSSVEELKGLVLQSLAELREEVARSVGTKKPVRGGRQSAKKRELPSPPDLLAIPSFVSGHEFVGRRAELDWLDEWAAGGEPMMVVEAIGGAGKSTLAWQWTRERARDAIPGLAGTFWYSFYEGGADMAAFAVYALAYTTGTPVKELRGKKTAELALPLLAALQAEPFLLVLDGFERVLAAYHRLDASQARDDQVDSGHDHRACSRPADADLLRQLVAAGPSKVLVTSRLMPAALANRAGQPIPGVRHRALEGLHPDDALAMVRRLGVLGDADAIRRYLTEHFDNHPLLVGIVGGLVTDYVRDPGNFDRWADDPQGGASLDLAKLDLSQRRTHILAVALSGLEPGTRQLLSRIAAFADAVPFDTVASLNPFLPLPLEEPNEPPSPDDLVYLHRLLKGKRGKARSLVLDMISEVRTTIAGAGTEREAYEKAVEAYGQEYQQALPRLVSALRDLERRGLLHWDRQKNSYDLHPVVRGYAFDTLEETDRTEISNRIVDHFQGKPADRFAEARTLADVQQSIGIFRALVQANRLEEAVHFYNGEFSKALLFSIEAPLEVLTLLKPLFPSGFSHLPHDLEKWDQSYLLTDLSIALSDIGRYVEAYNADVNALRLTLDEEDAHVMLSVKIGNLGVAFETLNQLARSHAAQELRLEFASVFGESDDLAMAYLELMRYYDITGRYEQAESAYAAFQTFPTPMDIYRPGEGETALCWLRFHQGQLTVHSVEEAQKLAQGPYSRGFRRELLQLQGELALSRNEALLAVTAFEHVVEMTRTAGLPTDSKEARLALAKAKVGSREHAREIAERLREQAEPPDVALAEVYLELGDMEKARAHALDGYVWAWADGPPHSRWSELERCRAVLKAVGEPEPALPPFDPAAVEPLPYEGEIRELIAKLARERAQQPD